MSECELCGGSMPPGTYGICPECELDGGDAKNNGGEI